MKNLKQVSITEKQANQEKKVAPIERESLSYKSFNDGIEKSGIKLTPKLFAHYKDIVYTYRPNVKRIIQEVDSLSIYNLAKTYIRANRNPIIKERKKEYIEVFKEEVRNILGSGVAESVARQLKDNDSMSTIQHSAPLGHPFVLNATLQNSLPYFNAQEPHLQNIIVLACSSVSFNNIKYPRGHLFHTFIKNSMFTNQLTFFGHAADPRPVIFHPAYEPDAIVEVKKNLNQLLNEGVITKDIIDKINQLIDDVYASPHALSVDNYHDQLTITNYYLFRLLFANYSKRLPNLIFLSQERLVLRLLKYHLTTNTVINRILFDSSFEALIIKYFDGIMGSFSLKNNYGTYLFWGYDSNKKSRIQLWKQGNFLVSPDGSFKIKLSPIPIEEALANNELIPSLLLIFIVLSFYYGQFLGGGPDQTMYLHQMKERFMNMMDEINSPTDKEAASSAVTNNFVISRPAFAFIEKNGKRIPATGLDLYLYGKGGKGWHTILNATKTTTLDTLVNRILVSFYQEYCPDEKKDKQLSRITERDIEKFTGLDKKIPAWATV